MNWMELAWMSLAAGVLGGLIAWLMLLAAPHIDKWRGIKQEQDESDKK